MLIDFNARPSTWLLLRVNRHSDAGQAAIAAPSHRLRLSEDLICAFPAIADSAATTYENAERFSRPAQNLGRPVVPRDGPFLVAAWGFLFTLGMLWVVNKVTRVRVSEKEEVEGLDFVEHGEVAYL